MHVDETAERLTLRLEGSDAVRGLPLANLEAFVDAWLSALRDFDRVRRLERPRKTGRPAKRSELVTALRLVAFKKGSAVLTVEPIVEESDDPELFEEGHTLAFANLRALLDTIEQEQPLDADVADALSRATHALGTEGTITVETPTPGGVRGNRVVQITEAQVRRLETRRPREAKDLTVSGRLHMIDLEPDRVAIRTAQGVEWTARYPESQESTFATLIGSVVWARGKGVQMSARTGWLAIEAIGRVAEYEQTSFFEQEPVTVDELLQRREPGRPHGLGVLVDDSDEEPSPLYYRVVLGL